MPAPIYTKGPATTPYKLGSEFTAPLGETLYATGQDAWIYSPFASIGRQIELSAAQGETRITDEAADLDPVSRRRALRSGEGRELVGGEGERRVLSNDEARQRIDAAGVDLSVPQVGVTSGALDILIERKQNEMRRQEILSRAPGGLGAGAARLGVGLGVTFLDPINIASAFIPVVGPARMAAALARQSGRLGRAGARARAGAIEGSVGATAVEPIIISAASAEQADYELTDSMLNVAFGTVAGAGLHAGFGAVSDKVGSIIEARKAKPTGAAAEALANAPFEMREAFARSSISQMIDGRMVDVEVVGNFTPVKAVDRKTFIPGKGEQIVSFDADEVARELDPGFMARIDRIRNRKEALRAEIENAKTGRAEGTEAAVADIDAEIEELAKRIDNATKRNRKKLEAKIKRLEAQREEIVSTRLGQDTPEMATKRRQLMELDEVERNIAPQLGELRRRADAEVDRRTSVTPSQPSSFRVTKAFEADRDFDAVARAEKSFATDNVRLADKDASIEVAERVKEYGSKDTEVAVDEELSDARADVEDIMRRTGLTEEDLRSADTDIEGAEQTLKDIEQYEKALEVGAMCSVGRG